MSNRIVTISLILMSGILSCLSQTLPSDWHLSLPAGMLVTGAVNVTNKCRSDAKFRLESKDLKFLTLPAEPVDVAGDRTVAVPVQLDTKLLKPGKYEGTLSIICVSCTPDSGCPAAREERKVILNVTAAMGGPQTQAGAAFDPKPVRGGEASAPISRTVSPTITALREFLKGPCPDRERDCDALRRQADARAEELKVLSAKATELQQVAAIAQKNADLLDPRDKSRKATDIRKNASSAKVDAASAVAAAAKASDASEGALSEYKKCLLRIQEECRKKN